MACKTLNVLYSLQFFQWGLFYKIRVAFGRKPSTTPLKPILYISSTETAMCTQMCKITKQETRRHTHKHSYLSFPCNFLSGRRVCALKDGELPKQETHRTYIYILAPIYTVFFFQRGCRVHWNMQTKTRIKATYCNQLQFSLFAPVKTCMVTNINI